MKTETRGRKATTGKFETRAELIKSVCFFYKTQSMNQVARACGVSSTTVNDIIDKHYRAQKGKEEIRPC